MSLFFKLNSFCRCYLVWAFGSHLIYVYLFFVFLELEVEVVVEEEAQDLGDEGEEERKEELL